MQVKMLVAMAGGVSLAPGDVHECDAEEAKRMIEAGHAVPHGDKPIERAVKATAPEKRAKA
jgi:hypothetical protein